MYMGMFIQNFGHILAIWMGLHFGGTPKTGRVREGVLGIWLLNMF